MIPAPVPDRPDEAAAVVRLVPAQDDAELVRRVRAGDAWAEEALYRRHAPRVHRVVLRILGRPADAEDALQETFVTAFEHLGELRDPAAVSGWLLRIAVRHVHRRLRRRQVRRWLGLDEEAAEVLLDPAPGATPEDKALCGELAVVLAALPAAERIAWMLHHVEGHTLEEAALAAGCSLATVKRRIAAAHAVVRRSIELEEPS